MYEYSTYAILCKKYSRSKLLSSKMHEHIYRRHPQHYTTDVQSRRIRGERNLGPLQTRSTEWGRGRVARGWCGLTIRSHYNNLGLDPVENVLFVVKAQGTKMSPNETDQTGY